MIMIFFINYKHIKGILRYSPKNNEKLSTLVIIVLLLNKQVNVVMYSKQNTDYFLIVTSQTVKTFNHLFLYTMIIVECYNIYP